MTVLWENPGRVPDSIGRPAGHARLVERVEKLTDRDLIQGRPGRS